MTLLTPNPGSGGGKSWGAKKSSVYFFLQDFTLGALEKKADPPFQ